MANNTYPEVWQALAALVEESGGTWTGKCNDLADDIVESMAEAVVHYITTSSGKSPLMMKQRLAGSLKPYIER